MNRKLGAILLVLILILTAYLSYQVASRPSPTPGSLTSDLYQSRIEEYALGESSVSIVLFDWSESPLLFFNMHDDENTSVEAAIEVLPEKGGSLLHLEHGGERLIEFVLEDTVYRFDPNRIFTDTGARLTLQRYGPFSTKAFQIVRRFARHLVERYRLEERPVIIALHNNTEGTYSTESYLPGGEYADDASDVFLKPESDPDDFFFVTEAELFQRFKGEGFNVVLQDNERVTDDGSLSVLAGQAGIPYINVEAQHEHLEKQKEMLRVLYGILASIQSPGQ